MRQEDLKLLQSTEVGILADVAALCEKHGLRYFLDSGTLIGAIRHDGFIPWDDDIDIAMPCEDYYRFLEIAPKELEEKYYLLNHETAEHFYNAYTKVCLKGTTVRPSGWKYWDIPIGAWIDIFPMFYADSDREIKRKKILFKFCSLLQAKNYYRNLWRLHEKKTAKSALAYVLIVLLGAFPVKMRQKLHSKLLKRMWAKKDGRYLCTCDVVVRKFEKSSFMGPVCYHKFEYLSLRIPNEYDKVLRSEYDDYMQFPPEDKRGKHGELEIVI